MCARTDNEDDAIRVVDDGQEPGPSGLSRQGSAHSGASSYAGAVSEDEDEPEVCILKMFCLKNNQI